MAKYTLELRDLVEAGYYPFNFQYPIFDETKRQEIEEMFIRFYYFREISEETIERWFFKFKTRVLDIINVYNKKWLAVKQEIEPFSNNGGESSSKTIFNDTPDSRLQNEDYATNITENVTKTKSYTGVTQTDLLNNYLDGLRDITHEFINEFEDLFIKIF